MKNIKIDSAYNNTNLDQNVRKLVTEFDKEFGISQQSIREWQDEIILDMIKPGDTVLDLGCGEGSMLQKLKERGADVQGVEIDFNSVMSCIEKGVEVFQANLDKGLDFFPDNSFDYVLLEETAQTLKNPKKTLEEMLRIGDKSIISFPNFGYWKVRAELLAGGKMPVTDWLPYSWADTPNIHLFTLKDFQEWIETGNAEIVTGYTAKQDKVTELGDNDNLEAEEVLLVLKKR